MTQPNVPLAHEDIDVPILCKLFVLHVLVQNILVGGLKLRKCLATGGILWLLASTLLVVLNLQLVFHTEKAERLALMVLEYILLSSTFYDRLEAFEVLLRVIS